MRLTHGQKTKVRADRSAKREADLVRSGSKIDFHRLTLVSGETPIVWGETAAVKVEENHLGLIHQMKTETVPVKLHIRLRRIWSCSGHRR
jgi:hypothetical protein